LISPPVCEVGRNGTGLAYAVGEAVAVLGSGGILAHPTETLYGIGGAATQAVDEELDRLKGRAPDRFSVLRIGFSIDIIRDALPELMWKPEADRLAERFWPGPLTLVLPLQHGGGVAVRVEGHALTRAVLEAWGGIIGSTSLNRSGEDAAWTSRQARRILERLPDSAVPVLLLDAGDLPGPPPSTLVSLTGESPVVLRAGAVPVEAIESCLSERRGG
jgi:L-threonylcarbamoyladenylate synthase